MNSFSFSFENPWMLLALIPVLALLLFPFFRMKKSGRRHPKHWVPTLLHSLIALFLVLLLSGFTVVRSTAEKAVLILVDCSDSMASVQEQVKAKTQEILDVIDEDTACGVIAFGYDQAYEMTLSENGRYLELGEVVSDGTDPEAALRLAETVFPKDKAKQVILLSDGMETDGQAQTFAHYLATQGVRIDCIYFDTTAGEEPEMQIGSFSAPEGIWKDESAILSCEISSNVSAAAELEWYEGSKLLKRESLSVKPGKKVVELTVTPDRSGMFTYRAVLSSAKDTEPRNNAVFTHMKVIGAPSVLILADKEENALFLKETLSQEGFVTVCEQDDAPKTLAELCDYDQVILSNVDMVKLPRGYGGLLDSYVNVFGRSLLVAGGKDTYMFGNMKNTPLEEMLPITFDYQKSAEGKKVALMLVLDISRSMSNNANYLSVAKQGAIKCVEAMTDNDTVGLVTFHSQAQLRSSLIPGTQGNKDKLTRIISGLTTDQRTNYTHALELARDELLKSDSEIRHIIFLSDGQPKDTGYHEVVKDAASKGITVSTIGLGYSSEILDVLASAGGGRYYYVASAQDLPDIMLSETKQMTVSSLVEEKFVPQIARDSDITDGMADMELPYLNGFLGTTAKETASVYLTTEEGDPLFATQSWGKGTVAAFTSDLIGNWSERWFSVSAGLSLIQNMSAHLVGGVKQSASFFTEYLVGGKRTEIVVTTYEPVYGSFSLSVMAEGEEEVRYVFEEAEPGVFKTAFLTPRPGLYQLVIVQTDSGGKVIDYMESAVSHSYSSEYDRFSQEGNAFLGTLASYSEGILGDDAKAVAEAEVTPIDLVWDPLTVFSVLSLLMFLAGLAIRLLRWKDVQVFFNRFKIAKR